MHNLTAIEDAREVAIKHFLDSLTLSLCFEERNVRVGQNTFCDVGSGAGFPGVPLSIYYGSLLNITLIESVSKKCAFLEFIRAELDLSYEVVCKRAEHITLEFDYAVCRALGKLKEIEPTLLKLSRKGAFVMKGKEVPEGYQFCKVELRDIRESYIIFIPKTK